MYFCFGGHGSTHSTGLIIPSDKAEDLHRSRSGYEQCPVGPPGSTRERGQQEHMTLFLAFSREVCCSGVQLCPRGGAYLPVTLHIIGRVGQTLDIGEQTDHVGSRQT